MAFPGEVERAAFNLLSQVCTGSPKSRNAVTSAPGFTACFERALKLVESTTGLQQPSDSGSAMADDNSSTSESENKAPPVSLSLVEAAYAFLSSTTFSAKIKETLVTNSLFIEACSDAARQASTDLLRMAALNIIARLSRCTCPGSALTPEKAGDLLTQTLVEDCEFDGPEGSRVRSAHTIAADGLHFVFDKLQAEKQETVIQEAGKLYSSVIKNRSLSKLKTAFDRAQAGELVYCLTRIMLVGMGNKCVEHAFGTAVITSLVGTVQWRFDAKTAIESDEIVYWEAATTHSLLILASWVEQGRPFGPDATAAGKLRTLKENVWMVARPGKAPRKAVDFGTALASASKSAEASARLAADRLLIWLAETR